MRFRVVIRAVTGVVLLLLRILAGARRNDFDDAVSDTASRLAMSVLEIGELMKKRHATPLEA